VPHGMWHFSIVFLLLTTSSWLKKAANAEFCLICVLSLFWPHICVKPRSADPTTCASARARLLPFPAAVKEEAETKMAAPVPAPAAKASAMSQLRIQTNEGKLEGLAALTAAVIVALFLIAVSLGLNNQLVP
jgi:hypothetical protein